MAGQSLNFLDLVQHQESFIVKKGVAEALPYYMHSHRAWLYQVVGVKTVVAELVEKDLVGGKVGGSRMRLLEYFTSQQKNGLSTTVLDQAVT